LAMVDSSVLDWQLFPPHGFHPVSHTRLRLGATACRTTSCTLHLLHALPPEVFADPYELELYAASYAFNFSSGQGRVDLEAPVFALPLSEHRGRVLHISVNTQDACAHENESEDVSLDVHIPLHLRYGLPQSDGRGYVEASVPPPEAFWACALPDSTDPRAAPPALSTIVASFPAHSLHVVDRAPGVRSQTVFIPVGDVRDLSIVEAGTVAAVLFAFIWVAWKVVRTRNRLTKASDADVRQKGE